MSLIELKIPDIGGHDNVNVAEVYIKVGDKLNVDDNICMLETDKATMEVPAEKAGVVKEVLIKPGSTVNEGDVVVKIEAEGGGAATDTKTQKEEPKADKPAPANSGEAAKADGAKEVVPVTVPDLSGHRDVGVIEIAVAVGDSINLEDTIMTLETDKATMEIPSTAGGVIKEIKVKVGDKVNQGDLIVMVETEVGKAGDVASAAPASNLANPEATPAKGATQGAVPPGESNPAAVSPSSSTQTSNMPPKVDEASFAKAFASPSIRKLARELGVDLGRVKGSAEKERITEDDLKNFVKSVMTGQASSGASGGSGVGLDILPWPKVDFAKFGEIRTEPMSRIKKLSGANLSRNWIMIPHVTVFENVDITEMEEFRKQLNEEYKRAEIKVTPLAFLIKAAVFALKKFPAFNASIDGDNIIYKDYYNIGFAADTPNGLVVPVVKNADQKGIVEIAQETSALAKAARDGKLKPTDMQGGTFTVSSLGGLGSTAFTPIINAPEVAILGVSKSSISPVWNGKEFAPRLMLPLSLSFDHRIIDGAAGAKFASFLAQVLSDLRRLAL